MVKELITGSFGTSSGKESAMKELQGVQLGWGKNGKKWK